MYASRTDPDWRCIACLFVACACVRFHRSIALGHGSGAKHFTELTGKPVFQQCFAASQGNQFISFRYSDSSTRVCNSLHLVSRLPAGGILRASNGSPCPLSQLSLSWAICALGRKSWRLAWGGVSSSNGGMHKLVLLLSDSVPSQGSFSTSSAGYQ